MFIKVVNPAAWDFHEPLVQQVKMSCQGLCGVDRSAIEKRASVDFMQRLDQIKVAKDEPLLHMIIVGATEDYGPNRNGDGFTRDTCRRFHDTFVKHARFYRDHQNKDPQKSYGRIKLSAFNEPMKRIEVLIGLNGSKAVAEKNGGLVADKELEKLASGTPIGGSMACRIRVDVCSYCGNEAAHRAEYCKSADSGGHCKAGGLSRNIGALVDIDGGLHHLHADNPEPDWFDVSHVYRPADRIAYAVGELEKAANAQGRVVTGAELANAVGITLPDSLLLADTNGPANMPRMLKLAQQLAAVERQIETEPVAGEAFAAGFMSEIQGACPAPPPLYREKFGQFLRALADVQVLLPLPHFVQLTTGQPAEKAAEVSVLVQRALPRAYRNLCASADFAKKIAVNPYTPASCAGPHMRSWAAKQAAAASLRPHDLRRRTCLAVFQGVKAPALRQAPGEKTAEIPGAGDAATRLAEQYALYKLAFLGTIPEETSEFPLTTSLLIVQNSVV